ncbi:hypothetical protein [Chryseobacterium sp. Mn2064]|uniref:hypothetical protein n=1 Tax=Chryseobacterium sp. Mn2064 TaxID=3395263 RepID=UPI003BDA3607
MKKSICTCLLSLFSLGAMKSQSKAPNPLLLQTWNLKSADTYIYTYEKQDAFEKKRQGLRFQKNDKITGNLNSAPYKFDTEEDINPKKLKFDLYIGNWKKVSDTTINILFPSNSSMNGTFIITRLTENELKLKKLFSAEIEKKLDSIRRTKNIGD